MAFNTGSIGPEQKITILGIKNEAPFFIKFAQTTISKANVRNEFNILKLIQGKDFAPKILDYKETEEYVLLKTNIFVGDRYSGTLISTEVIDILLNLARVEFKTYKNSGSEIQKCFAHGDFCPWNMILANEEIKVFDWEMAGHYPVGYDLFTFIFQTSFLLQPAIPIEQILMKSQKFIVKYFEEQGIYQWNKFLIAFAELKFKTETSKKNYRLTIYYKQLLNFAKKT